MDVDVETVVEAGFPPEPASAATARRHVVGVLRSWSVDSDVAELLVSELATNAILHAATGFRVIVRRLERSVRVEVVDSGAGVARPNRYSNTAGTGRGLTMVEEMSLAWGADATVEGKCVWFEVSAPPHIDSGPRPETPLSGVEPPSARPGGHTSSGGTSARLFTSPAA